MSLDRAYTVALANEHGFTLDALSAPLPSRYESASLRAVLQQAGLERRVEIPASELLPWLLLIGTVPLLSPEDQAQVRSSLADYGEARSTAVSPPPPPPTFPTPPSYRVAEALLYEPYLPFERSPAEAEALLEILRAGGVLVESIKDGNILLAGKQALTLILILGAAGLSINVFQRARLLGRRKPDRDE